MPPASDYPDTQLLIGGQWRGGAKGDELPVVNPATGAQIGRLACAAPEDLAAAADAADVGFRRWNAVSAYERSKIMRMAAGLLRERTDTIATVMTMEQGKPLAEARTEVMAAADIIEWFSEEGRRTYGQVIPAREGKVTQLAVKLPVGPVAAFTPWNFPVNQIVRKLSAGLAAGCSVIVKAPEETPASAAALIRVFHDAGVPDGAVGLVFGNPGEISEYLIAHPAIRKISFTGSTAVGKHLAALAGQYMKRATMELGGHAPAMIFDDADADAAVGVLAAAKFRNAGQVCVSPTRFLVQRGCFERVLGAFTRAAESVQVGCGLKSENMMGPLANARRLTAIDELIGDAVSRGARITTGGRRIGNVGNFFAPTVLADVPIDARIMNEEPFGPVAVFSVFDTLEQVIEEANRLPFGLASYAFTGSGHTANELGSGPIDFSFVR